MATLKKLFPLSFSINGLVSLIIIIFIYAIIATVAGFAIGLLAHVPIVKIVVGILGGVVEVYVLTGVILSILCFLGIVK